jgi:hypothetical protein
VGAAPDLMSETLTSEEKLNLGGLELNKNNLS